MRRRIPFSILAPAVALTLVLWAATGPAARAEDWDPKRTHALLVGVLEWRDPGLSAFPKEGRVDRILERQLVAAGVPAGNITFLEDRAATGEAVKRELEAVAAGAVEGGTLIVYYAGHGLQHEREVWFASWDCDPARPEETSFGVSTISRILEARWKGGRLLLLADCCYSGGLAVAARRFDGLAGAASLTSSNASNISTGNWTFTESVVTAFRGDGLVDADGDGAVTFGETDAYVAREMRFLEAQLTRAFSTPKFPKDLVLARVPAERRAKASPPPWRIGDYVEVEWKREWFRARVIDGRGKGEWKVHYLGFGAEWDEWVPAARVRKPRGLAASGGDAVEVEWKGKWWPAKVMRVEDDFAFIHYDGFGAEWDEWVTAKRLRKRGGSK